METEDNPEIAALRALCEANGGFKAVAKVLDVHDQTLYQILSGVALPSGRPKGIGPKIREALNANYPGWNVGARHPLTSAQTSKRAAKLAKLFDMISDPQKSTLAYAESMDVLVKYLGNDAASLPEETAAGK